jgi:hypothetical protein
MFNLVQARSKNIVSAGLLMVGYLSVPVMGQASPSGKGLHRMDATESLGELPPLLSLSGHGGWGDSSGNKGSYRSRLDIVRDGSSVVMTSVYEGAGFNQNFSVLLEPVAAGFLIKMDGETIGNGQCQGGQQCTLRYAGEQAVTETLFLQGNQWLRFGQKTVGGARIF